MKENIITKGSLEIIVKDSATRQTLKRMSGDNLIVSGGIINVAKLLGGDLSGKSISKVGFGEGLADPSPQDNALVNGFYKNIDSVTYPSMSKVQFTFSLAAGEANGLKITELGLFNADLVMFSRKTRPEILKTSAIILTGIWTITIN
ncbi:hypothetical protein CLU97_3676 [Chryseobacterium sp. 7]|uniref:hypothetical protein n=1 Tax=Chryseobacterium sp. 7 TaxID=2035214 RepID=UPI000EB49BE6|nr:hypothetical protein [Chryseobacterium sp. 7]RLJ34181.1 hypothetical protein CLU97_3676 [Chryseobacterium sp. 7]